MQTLSSASRTCIASASAVEWTATVAMPISLQARLMRSAISPRLAIRTFSNIGETVLAQWLSDRLSGKNQQRLAELDRLPIAHAAFADGPTFWRNDGVHGFHGLHDQ